MPSRTKALPGSIDGMFRGSWHPAPCWMGFVGRAVAVALLRSFARSTSGILQTARPGALRNAQWRSYFWEAPVAKSSSPIPCGLIIQTLFAALSNFNAPDHRFVSHIIDGSQLSEEAQDIQENEDIAMALKLVAAEASQTCSSRL